MNEMDKKLMEKALQNTLSYRMQELREAWEDMMKCIQNEIIEGVLKLIRLLKKPNQSL